MVFVLLAGLGCGSGSGGLFGGKRRPGQRRELYVGVFLRNFPDSGLERGEGAGTAKKTHRHISKEICEIFFCGERIFDPGIPVLLRDCVLCQVMPGNHILDVEMVGRML